MNNRDIMTFILNFCDICRRICGILGLAFLGNCVTMVKVFHKYDNLFADTWYFVPLFFER